MNQSNDRCQTCSGTGEAATENGVVDCPDCGGAGQLPTRGVRVQWRAADIQRTIGRGRTVENEHVKWLLDELHVARGALTEVIALSHDARDEDNISKKIRFIANRALGLYEVARVNPSADS